MEINYNPVIIRYLSGYSKHTINKYQYTNVHVCFTHGINLVMQGYFIGEAIEENESDYCDICTAKTNNISLIIVNDFTKEIVILNWWIEPPIKELDYNKIKELDGNEKWKILQCFINEYN